MSARERLRRSFFARPATAVAPDLLGRVLVRILPDGTRLAGRLVEVEAYEPGDPASHSFRGMTARNATMFGRPGRLYVYFAYGSHWMSNVVTRADGEGSAVLLRALEPLEGIEEMARRRGRERPAELCSGPGKICEALAIDRGLDGEDLVDGRALWIEAGEPIARPTVATTGRVGVSVGVEARWRFLVDGDPFVSRGRPGPAARGPGSRRPSTR